MLGIVIVSYNVADLLPLQLDAIKAFCTDQYEIIVVDNSTDNDASEAIKYHAREHLYYRTRSLSTGSRGHAFALNFIYEKLRREYDYFLFLDHDIFPTAEFSVIERLSEFPLGGLAQQKSKLYLWPGYLFLKCSEFEILDFSPCHDNKLDTGGRLYEEVESLAKDGRLIFVSEEYVENPYFKKLPYNFYSVIDKTWIHFINASGWNKVADNEERINSLKNIVQRKINENRPADNSDE